MHRPDIISPSLAFLHDFAYICMRYADIHDKYGSSGDRDSQTA